jgi:hypothetical protein
MELTHGSETSAQHTFDAGEIPKRTFTKFPRISATKNEEGVFVDSQICMLYRGKQYDGILSGNGKTAMTDSRLVAANFLGNNKADNSNTLAENVLFYQQLHCNVFQDTFHELSLRYFPRKLWSSQ